MTRSSLFLRAVLGPVLALALVAAGACGDDDDTAPGSGASLRDEKNTTRTVPGGIEAPKTIQDGKLVACIAMPAPPFAFEDEGKPDGIDVELVRAVGGRLGLTADFRTTPASALYTSLEGQQCDIVAAAVAITDEAEKEHLLSRGYLKITQSLLVRKGDEAKYADLAALQGKTIGVETGSAGATYAKANAQGATIKEFADTEQLTAALTAGTVAAVVHDFPVNAYNAQTTGTFAVSKRFTDAAPVEYGFVMPKDREDLKKAIDGALEKLLADDTFPTILRRLLGVSSVE